MTTTQSHGRRCRVLSALLRYPDAGLRAAYHDLGAALDAEPGLSPAARAGLARLLDRLVALDALDIEAEYVATFDHGRKTSLHLFEHVHGDSRDRGPAMIDLHQTYEAAGFCFVGDELPDYLPAVLEFVSTQPQAIATGFLGETAHILNAIHSALAERRSPYAAVIAAVLEFAGQPIRMVAVEPEASIDAIWAEPEAFDGCSTKGQQRPGQPQPVHLLRPAAGAARRAA